MVRKPLSVCFIETYCRLPPKHQAHTIESFKLALTNLDPDEDADEIQMTKEAIKTLSELAGTIN
jgi:hypothetical protein